jgi:two-component system sensor histidine kinase RegB
MLDKDNVEQLKYILILRAIAIVSQSIVIFAVHFGLGIQLPLLPIIIIDIVLFAINIGSFIRVIYIPNSCSQLEIFIQLVIDIFSLAGVLYFCGGSSNPFISFFILQVIIAATILDKIYLWLLVAITIICYTFLMYYNVPIHYLARYHIGNYFDMHIHGMWVSFIMISVLVAYFVVKLSTILKQRDAQLAASRERIIKDDHIVALGAIAASTAHDLGTPLATIAIISKELEHEYQNDVEIIEKLKIIRSQIDRCKSCLSQLSLSIGEIRAEGGTRLPLDKYLNNIIQSWQQFNAKANLRIIFDGEHPAPVIIADRIIEQIIINPLTNAMQAAMKYIDIRVSWSQDQLQILIEDDGNGLSDEVIYKVGTPSFTTKVNGKGLGVFLTESIIIKLGGKFSLSNKLEGIGACAKIELPLAKFKVSN